MESIKAVVLVACIVGICDKIVSVMCGDRYKSQMKLITALVMIVSVASQLGDDIEIPELDNKSIDLEYAENRAKEDYLTQIEHSLANKTKEIYRENNIEIQKAVIACSYDEYKYICIDRITVYLSEGQYEERDIKSIAKEYFPDAEITVIQ